MSCECGGVQKSKLRYLSEFLSHSERSCEFWKTPNYLKFFLKIFLKLPNFFKGAPASDFRLSTPKKGPKNAPMTSKSIFGEGSKNSNAPRFRVQGTYATQKSPKKIIFQTHKPKKLFFEFIDPQIFKKKSFSTSKKGCFKYVVDLKNRCGSTFWDAVGPSNTIWS